MSVSAVEMKGQTRMTTNQATVRVHDADGVELDFPAIGFGTYQLNGRAGAQTITEAIDTGYTLIDTAFTYENEGAVGRGVARAAVPREQLLVSSKLPGRHHAYEQARTTVEESLYRTGLDRLDLYLIHWPNPKVDRYVEAWRALIDARDAGLIRWIGVSNFLPEHLDRLAAETGELPVVNQIEMHPHFPQLDALAYHREHGIATEAWSPLGRGHGILDDPVVEQIATAHGVGPGSVVLAWHHALGAIPLPKASSHKRQLENLAAVQFDLTEAEVDAITALGRPDGRLAGQDPATYEEF